MDIQRFKQLSYHFYAQEKSMKKTKVEIYQEVLRDVSQNFQGTKKFIKQRIQEICNRKKISVKKAIYFSYVYKSSCL